MNPSLAFAMQELQFAWPHGPLLLNIPRLQLRAGQSLFIHGPSGSGKSTFLGLLGGVLQAQQGSLQVVGHDFMQLRAAQRDAVRGQHLGFIFQQFNLLPYLSVFENIALPARLHPQRMHRFRHRQEWPLEIERLIRALGLPEQICHQPVHQLSVGQQQRVAAARALLGGPQLLIADEPTSALDADTQNLFMRLILDECQRHGTSLVMVSHDQRLQAMFDHHQHLTALKGTIEGQT